MNVLMKRGIQRTLERLKKVWKGASRCGRSMRYPGSASQWRSKEHAEVEKDPSKLLNCAFFSHLTRHSPWLRDKKYLPKEKQNKKRYCGEPPNKRFYDPWPSPPMRLGFTPSPAPQNPKTLTLGSAWANQILQIRTFLSHKGECPFNWMQEQDISLPAKILMNELHSSYCKKRV
jgi:hypothetical protein